MAVHHRGHVTPEPVLCVSANSISLSAAAYAAAGCPARSEARYHPSGVVALVAAPAGRGWAWKARGQNRAAQCASARVVEWMAAHGLAPGEHPVRASGGVLYIGARREGG